ncbi:lipid A export ATP-binding/permease protein MsbA [Streptomyces sp. L-9-10]|uniref:ABC transporter ATP-binding protein n=1 Tax=Streptomyces sp. L-9-10 TaxID=1478131 RepID=UPI00101B71CE|nr:ABC transporter ATP-binding protein [Streptomyces sp. L-9-10]RYJ29191.1 lipid A export ATP-binding/permease protein MsbA [Streptomyces sp. L-9-10]
MAEQPDRIRTADLMRSCAYIVRIAWQADRLRLTGVFMVQLLTATGLAALILVLRGTLGQAFSLNGEGSRANDRLIPALSALVLLASVGGILRTVSSGWQRLLTVKIDRHIMAKVLAGSARAELARFEDPAFHDRLQRAVFASRSQPVMVVTALIGAVQALLSMVAVGTAFAVMTWWLLPFTALSVLPVLKAARDERDADYRLHGQLAEGRRVREYLERLLVGRDEAKEIRSLDLGGMLRDRWDGHYAEEISSTATMQRRHTRRKVVARVLGDLVFLAVICAMWGMVRGGGVALPTALAALGALLLLSTRMQMLGYLFNNIGAAALYVKDIRVFTDADGDGDGDVSTVRATETDTTKTKTNTTETDRAAPAPFASLRTEHLAFTYPGSPRPALHDVSVELRAGEIVALVGANGSGKTTLAKILAGLYQPDDGTLLRDGLPVPDPARLRAATAMVFQDFVRYKLSASDNIAFGRPHDAPDRSAVARAADSSGAADVIGELPLGYDTVLSKEFTAGADLSLGQWQRLALARAFYRDSPFVILDEPTASLDPQAEADLFARIRTLFADRTVLVISHRFSNVRGADRIYVMDGGRIIEEGGHDELEAAGGTYARLFHLQAEAYQDGERNTGDISRPAHRAAAVPGVSA